MTEDVWVQHWTSVAESVYFTHSNDRQKPTACHLNALEARLAFHLPMSYRAFVRVFGPGRLAQAFTVYAAGYLNAPVIDFPDPGAMTSGFWQMRRFDPAIQEMIAFGDFMGSAGFFCWKRTAVRDAGQAVYFVPRLPEKDPVLISESFADWIQQDILGSSFYAKMGEPVTDEALMWEDDDTGEVRSHRCFEPIGDILAPPP